MPQSSTPRVQLKHNAVRNQASETPPTGRLRLDYLPIGSLKHDPRNPRQHSRQQIKQIGRSIQSFGFNVPVLIDRGNNILAGHGRVQAAQTLGLGEVPVIRIESLTDAQARAFAIADNRLAEHATWDDRLLGEIFSELVRFDLDFDLEATGFSIGEIDLRIEGLGNSVAEGPDPADQLPDAGNQPAVSIPGDLWHLGPHRLLCGNALESSAFDTLMDGRQAAMVFADPPYNVRIDGHATGKGAIRHREFAMASGEMTEVDFTAFLTTTLDHLARFSAASSVHYICMDWRHITELLTAGRHAYPELINLCVWAKNSGGMGSFYRSRHELIFVFANEKGTHRNNVQLGRYGRNRTNVWEYPGVATQSRQGEEGNLLALHPTVKPVALIADAILDASVRSEIVLDAFLGSGSTLLAAERVGRICYGMELDPLYVDTVIRRWERYTGGSAIHAATGKTFSECEPSREDDHE
jgi:DNA modification methylase